MLGQIAGSLISSIIGSKMSGGIEGQNKGAGPDQANMPMIDVGNLVGQAGNQMGKKLTEQLIQRLFGEKSDPIKDAKKSGAAAAAYYDQAFPGTNPWERLGSGNPSGQLSVADKNIKNQKEMQAKELKTRENIASIQANTQLQTAEIAAQAPNRMASVGEAKLAPEIAMLDAGTKEKIASAIALHQRGKLIGNENLLMRSRALIADELANAELTDLQNRNIRTSIMNVLNDPEATAGGLGAIIASLFGKGPKGGNSTKKPTVGKKPMSNKQAYPMYDALQSVDPEGRSTLGRYFNRVNKAVKNR